MTDNKTAVARWRLGLVVLVTLTSVAAAIWLISRADSTMFQLFGLWVLCAPVPLMFARDAANFRTACFVAGGVLAEIGLFLALTGLIVYVPSGFALLAVGLTDRRSGPVWATISMLVSVISLVCWIVGIIERLDRGW